VELGIGVCALATPAALGAMHRGVIAVSPHLPDSLVAVSLVGAAVAFGVLLVPTALMGATMPVVIKSSLTRLDGLGSRVGVLYATNTTGAIVGASLAGFYLIPQIGLSRSFLLAASVNTVVGLMAVVASRFVPAGEAGGTEADRTEPGGAPAPRDEHTRTFAGARLVLAVSAISGFASLALEIVWFRVLAIFLGPVSYTFTVILALVLTGIALGSAVAAPLLRWRKLDWMQVLAALQFIGAMVVLRSFNGLIDSPAPPAWLAAAMNGLGIGFALPAAGIGAWVVLPSALVFGMAFPIGLRLWVGAGAGESEAGRRVGVFYFANLGGAILGSAAAGFLLIPLLGTRGSLVALAALYALAGAALQAVCARRWPMVTGFAVVSAVAFLLQMPSVPDPLEVAHRRIYLGRPVIWQAEGMQTTVAVAGGLGNRVMYLDGHHQANDTPNMVFIHQRIGLLPTLVHPNPRRALVVGLGGGVTPGAMTRYPGLTLDVVELSAGVAAGAAYFDHVNASLLTNPNVRIRMDDGRNFLQRVRTPYDVITADAIVPTHAGANNLNSVEYFRLVRGALAPDGVVLHWNGGHTQAQYTLILKAFSEAFPHTTVWADGSLMVGSMQPFRLSRSRIEALLARPDTRDALERISAPTFDALVSRLRAGPDDVRAFVRDTPVLSDDRPLLEYYESLPKGERVLDALSRNISALIVP